MLLFSLQLSSGTFATSVCVLFRPMWNRQIICWQLVFKFYHCFNFFYPQDSQWFLNDLSNFWNKLIVRSSQKIQELILFFPQPRSSASILCSNYLVICVSYITNNFVLQGQKRIEFELEIWRDNSYRTTRLGYGVEFQQNNVPGRVLPIQN